MMNAKFCGIVLALVLSLGTVKIVPARADSPIKSPTVVSSLAQGNIEPAPMVLVYFFSTEEVCGGIIWGEGEVYDIAGRFLGFLMPNGSIVKEGQAVGVVLGI